LLIADLKPFGQVGFVFFNQQSEINNQQFLH